MTSSTARARTGTPVRALKAPERNFSSLTFRKECAAASEMTLVFVTQDLKSTPRQWVLDDQKIEEQGRADWRTTTLKCDVCLFFIRLQFAEDPIGYAIKLLTNAHMLDISEEDVDRYLVKIRGDTIWELHSEGPLWLQTMAAAKRIHSTTWAMQEIVAVIERECEAKICRDSFPRSS